MIHEELTIALPNGKPKSASPLQAVMAYAADLELEVDRLRRRDQFWQRESRERIKRIARLCKEPAESPVASGSPLAAIGEACRQFSELLHDLSEPPGYHPAFDQVARTPSRTDDRNHRGITADHERREQKERAQRG